MIFQYRDSVTSAKIVNGTIVASALNLNKGFTGMALRCNGAEALWFDGTYFSRGYGGTYNFFWDIVFPEQVAADPDTNHLVVNGTVAKPGGIVGNMVRFTAERYS